LMKVLLKEKRGVFLDVVGGLFFQFRKDHKHGKGKGGTRSSSGKSQGEGTRENQIVKRDNRGSRTIRGTERGKEPQRSIKEYTGRGDFRWKGVRRKKSWGNFLSRHRSNKGLKGWGEDRKNSEKKSGDGRTERNQKGKEGGRGGGISSDQSRRKVGKVQAPWLSKSGGPVSGECKNKKRTWNRFEKGKSGFISAAREV